MLVELSIAYHEIKEVVLRRFKPTGNFKVDVLSTREDKRLALANKIDYLLRKGMGHLHDHQLLPSITGTWI